MSRRATVTTDAAGRGPDYVVAVARRPLRALDLYQPTPTAVQLPVAVFLPSRGPGGRGPRPRGLLPSK
jgi:hypothetical protein